MKQVVIREIDSETFKEIIEGEFECDNIAQSCYTNFRDVVVRTIVRTLPRIIKENGWKLKYIEKNKTEKVFNAFMKNGQFKVMMVNKSNKFRKVIVKLDIPNDEKKRIAEIYLDELLGQYGYIEICILPHLKGKIEDVDVFAEALSDEVYGLLSPKEIIEIFG